MNGGFSGRDKAVDGRFAYTVNVTVGEDLHEKPVLPTGTHGIGFKLGDFNTPCPRCRFQ